MFYILLCRINKTQIHTLQRDWILKNHFRSESEFFNKNNDDAIASKIVSNKKKGFPGCVNKESKWTYVFLRLYLFEKIQNSCLVFFQLETPLSDLLIWSWFWNVRKFEAYPFGTWKSLIHLTKFFWTIHFFWIFCQQTSRIQKRPYQCDRNLIEWEFYLPRTEHIHGRKI